MDNTTPTASTDAPKPKWLYLVRVLLFIALAGGSYLAYVSIHNGPAAGCGVGSGCSAVLQSRWAYWLMVPVSVPAVLVYLALLGSTVMLRRSKSPDDERGAWAAIIVLSVVVMGAAFWFVSLQVFVIKAFCKYCLTAHACGFMAALITLSKVPYATDPETPMWRAGSGKQGVPRQAMLQLVLVGLIGVTVLAVGQVFGVQKERNVVTVVSTVPVAPATNQVPNPGAQQPGNPPAEEVPSTPNAFLAAPRTLSLYSNEFMIKLGEVPMMGSPDAPHVIVCLVDYTCTHCRALHPILWKLSEQYSNQIGIICLPVTLSPKCNPYIARGYSADPASCEYARLALAVWRARPDMFHDYDNWLFGGVYAPPVNEARQQAADLVGADKLQAAMDDPWVEQQIQMDAKIHRANWLAVNSSALPQIVMGNAVSSGPINSQEHLQILLGKYLGLNLGMGGN